MLNTSAKIVQNNKIELKLLEGDIDIFQAFGLFLYLAALNTQEDCDLFLLLETPERRKLELLKLFLM